MVRVSLCASRVFFSAYFDAHIVLLLHRSLQTLSLLCLELVWGYTCVMTHCWWSRERLTRFWKLPVVTIMLCPIVGNNACNDDYALSNSG